MRASRSRTRDAANLLTATPDEVALAIACFLATARDLLCLRLTCRRFSTLPHVHRRGRGSEEMLCIVEEAARRWVAGRSEQERGWVPRRELESWLCLMHEVEMLRLPLAFGRAHDSFTLIESGAAAAKNASGSRRAATSNVTMRSGRHFAQFTVLDGQDGGQADMMFGVIRPGWDVERGSQAYLVDGHCFYDTFDGSGHPGDRDWEGQQDAREQGDRIGMLLDLDQGRMSVYKGGERLGVMVAEGLTGPLCWALEAFAAGNSARIESAPAPTSPTEELALAKEYRAKGLAEAETGAA